MQCYSLTGDRPGENGHPANPARSFKVHNERTRKGGKKRKVIAENGTMGRVAGTLGVRKVRSAPEVRVDL